MLYRLLLVSFALVALVACGGTAATPTPAFARYTADEVVAALRPLGVTDVRPLARDPQSVAPNTASDGREFAIPSIAPKGGQVQVFAEPGDLAAMQAWFARFPDLAPYVYVKGNALVQLNNTLPQAEAEKYRLAVEALP
jgi:hypothetical protein